MKKLAILAIVSMFSLSCMAGNEHTISIYNETAERIEVRDNYNHSVFVAPGKNDELTVELHTKRHNFFVPGWSKRPVTTITVTDTKEHKRTIDINNKTKSITVTMRNKRLKISQSKNG
jgi:hypothetical protein